MTTILEDIIAEVSKQYIGSPHTITALLVAIIAKGHILLEGLPGLAKTTLAQAFAKAISCDYKRIQCTMDLLPSDITGLTTFNTKDNDFNFHHGPIFTNILLVDEINRAPTKTQSAFLQAMQENSVSIDKTQHQLPSPFFLIATQNPIEERGIYHLPEAQLDRFMARLILNYPSFLQEIEILQNDAFTPPEINPILDLNQLQELIHLASKVTVHPDLLAYIVTIIQNTRKQKSLKWGASPRAAIALLRASKALACLNNRSFLLPDDIRYLAPLILNHRLVLSDEATLTNISTFDVINHIIQTTPYNT